MSETSKPSRRKPKRENVREHIGELKKRVSLFTLMEAASPPPRPKSDQQLKLAFPR